MNIIPNKVLTDKLHQNINVLNIILVVAVISVTFIVYYYNTRDIQLKIAYKGYGPQDYVNQKLKPENYKNDWQSGIRVYDNSIPMRIYHYLTKYSDISPTTTIYPFMFIQTLLFLSSVAFLTQTLFNNKFVTFLSIFIIPLSNIAGLNLSRFGNGYGSYLTFSLFYGYSNAFRIFALGFFLKNKYILMFVFLALSIYCHANMGIFALFFIGGYFLYKPRIFSDKSLIIGMLVFLALTVPHILSIIANSAITSGGIPVDQWVKSTRIFSFHWYPITMKLFTRNAHSLFFPLLLLCFFFFVTLRYQDIKDEKNVKILSGTIVCLILSVIGIIFSDIYPIPFLIKFSLQRSTGLITFFGVLYIIYYLFRKIDNCKIFYIFLAIYSLLLIVFAKPGIAVLPLFLLLYSDIREGDFGPLKIEVYKTSIGKSAYFIMAFLLLMLTLACIFQNNHKFANSMFEYLWTPLQYFNPFNEFDFLLRGGKFNAFPVSIYSVVGSSLIIAYKYSFRRNKAVNILFISIFFVISLSTVWYHERNQYLRWHNSYSKIASSYLDVQLWAKDNTPTDALFMPDPSHYYGWRDFSDRSSFGNLREWGYCAIAYNPDFKTYREGIKRMREFGISVEGVKDEDFKKMGTFIYGQKLNKELRKVFYSMNADELRALAKKYEIDYVVMKKKYITQPINLPITYKNEHYIVFCIKNSSGKF